ncbi:MAG TPA: 50S ribosomal protein L22 [Thermoanaerobaculia bacterium]|nr:50S ribosomal protein L22 [Thermoanaerobaculia bacterium]
MEATATLKYLKGSPQKIRLVADLVRGKKVDEALSILRFTKRTCARDLEKVLRSAISNAENSEANVDTDELVVSKIYVNEGPREKRIQPAPMGRAYRVQKRKAHVTVHVSDDVKAVNARSEGAPASAGRTPAPAGNASAAAPRRRAKGPAKAGAAAK